MMTSSFTGAIVAALSLAMALATPRAISAQEMTALARLETGASGASGGSGALTVELSLTQAVPYRVFTLDEPRRLVLDFREVDWSGFDPAAFTRAHGIGQARAGVFRPGWSRLVLALERPMRVSQAGMRVSEETGGAVVRLLLEDTRAEDFAARAGAPASELWGLPGVAAVTEPVRRQRGDRPLVVVLDPGHGGIDPGAERDGEKEARLMLRFARELKDVLLRSGRFEVVLTREDDRFVSLERRVSVARAARADLFLSLHADALPEGRATGATVYTLSDRASDVASARLAERHDRADLLAGVDLSDHDDVIAGVLMELARRETAPRSERLAGALVEGLREAEAVRVYKHPHLTAGFSVLKAPDIPSVLVELGFMSNPRDLDDLRSAEWRREAARGMAAAIGRWAETDAARARLVRQ